ncbi:phospholipid-translocating P-type ATPase [Lentinus tigrinus ALCF2SS1-7]|uniref:Phospholipid-transporting ATPase n=1 Tax=Lentinus tigrinus ALCF2SS1-6 TaxID=1328759 RepID=A0A5C2RZ98_9APHY|nr:phospholipid-translocating P-type ATPase [Lentinus tigrinus ALCF2SS1-6]RPD71501.1 phospholipid-translocating P-type ATPase [Lentinus tigrinus ALCF2SS1-7]
MSSTIARWYYKIADFNVEALFARKREPGPPRTVFVNQPLPDHYYDPKKRHKVLKEHVYCTNQVITSKYTVITFLPRNLLEQFRRIANIFFLAIAILQFFSIFSTVSPGLVILPLLIVLFITALKDGYEDIKRHQSDRSVNYSQVRVLAGGGFTNQNAMAHKEKTFVRAMVPKFKRSKKGAKKARADADVEHLQHSAPPEVLSMDGAYLESIPTRTEAGDENTDYEDGEPVEEPGGLFHHHHGASRRPHWKMTIWEDLRVGDIVKIKEDESFPADILICATSEEENVAYVETKNLDGETNLKSRNACPALTHLDTARACAAKENAFQVECDRPDTNLYKVHAAVVTSDGQKTAVDTNMVLLRGTVLRNTQWVIGVVLFTGEDSKIVLNSGATPSKRSRVERQMNPQVFINLLILAIMAIVCGIVDAVLEQRYFPMGAPWLYGDTQSDDNPRINGLITAVFALITFQNIVPISLYISIEAVRTCQALFIYFDREIFYEKTGQATLARSWNLSDDLGQIEYIFSDKTGTLTQNSMAFRRCTVGGRVYHGDEQVAEDDVARIQSVPEEGPDAKGAPDRLSRSSSPPSAKKSDASTSTTTETPDPLSAEAIKKAEHVRAHFTDAGLLADITAAQRAVSGSAEDRHGRMLNGFWTVLALCHTALVSVDPDTGAIQYKAQSPDEAALVQAAADVGFVFRGRDREILILQTPFSRHGKYERFELLNILDFTSARKRMSVILRKLDEDDEDGKVYLLSKGADNVIIERLSPGQDDAIRTTEEHLAEFASEGLRTLTLAYKVIPESQYESWSKRYHEASISLDDREDKVEAVSDEIEHDLHLLGATAIEDRLQDGVPEAIADLKEADIKIWVLTGDKLETAIAIGHSTNLIGRDDNIIIIRGGGEGSTPVYVQMLNAVEQFFPESGILQEDGVGLDESQQEQTGGYPLQRVNTGISSLVGHNNGERPGGFVLVIDGGALTHALSNDKHKNLLLRLAMHCEGVICCRVSPLQKALVVKLVKEGVGAMTLAIGDGANDVSMIQAADVGVGISGEEGLQAVNSSDYAIAQFRYLKRLLLVHGHWSYARNGNMIVNFFYKNVVCIAVLWWFQIYCAWSSQYVFEYTYLLFWNTFWTIAPVIGIGVFDRIVDDHVLMAMPELYRHSKNHEYFGTKLFLIYMFDALVQSVLIFFLILYSYATTSSRPDGYDVYQYEFATVMAIGAVMTADLFNGLNTHVWTGWIFFAVALGIVLVWAYTAIYSLIAPGWFPTPIYGNDHYLFRSAYFWFSIPLVVILACLPRYIAKAYKNSFHPSDMDRARWIMKNDPNHDFSQDRHGGLSQLKRPTSRFSRRSSLHRPSLFHASRTDMSTGLRSVNRGFDFATEENGVAMQRIQSHLSERHQLVPQKKRRRNPSALMNSFSISRTLRRKKRTSESSHPNDEPSSPSPPHSPRRT